MNKVIKVDGVGIHAHSFAAMSEERQAEEMQSIAKAHGKDEDWAADALTKVTDEYAKALEAEKQRKEKQEAAKKAMKNQ